VLVSHDGARWLPKVIAALEALTRAPDALVVVDTGSTDESVDICAAAFGADDVLAAPGDAPFAAAVGLGLDHRPPPVDGWIWLLHDDSAPAPDALAALLAEADRADVAVVGPKAREWPSLGRLVEVGLTIGGTGRRETGLEPGEPDQGQHDATKDVLAVGTAGLLVRAAVWRELGGLDPVLTPGDDLDLGWRAARAGHRVRVVPDALVFHAEAAAHGLRTRGSMRGRPRFHRRRSALLVLLANCRGAAFVPQWWRLLAGSLLRAVGLVLLKAPRDAWDELHAAASAHGRPLRLWRLRRARRRTARVPPGRVSHLLPPVSRPYRAGAATLADAVSGLVGSRRPLPSRSYESGPVAAEAESLPPEPTPWEQVAARPWAATMVVLVGLALITARGLLSGGELQGGALLPVPDGPGTWWADYLATWHEAGIGSLQSAPAYGPVLALAGLLTLGDPGWAVSLLMLGSMPLTGASAHLFLRRLPLGTAARVWAAAAYATTPLLTGALAQGRLGTILATAWLPLVAASAVDLARARPEAHGGLAVWMRRSRAGLALAVLVTLVPVAYPLALVVTAWLLVARLPARSGPPPLSAAMSAMAVLATPWLLAPWSLADRFRDPAGWWWEAGLADAGVGALAPGRLDLALGQPGGPGAAALGGWLGAGIVVGAVLALARSDTRAPVLSAWVVAVVGLGFAALGAGRTVSLPAAPAEVWTGWCLVVWWAGLLVAAAVGASGVRQRLAGRSFGITQPVATLVVVAAVVGPAVAACVAAIDGIDGPLNRGVALPVPSYMLRDSGAAGQVSAVLLDGRPTDGLTFTVVRDDGWRLGEEPYAPAARSATLSRALRDLLVAPQPANVATLAGFGVGYVYVSAPVDLELAAALDAAPGLVRAGAPTADRAWTLDVPVVEFDPSDAIEAGSTRRWWVGAQAAGLVALVLLAAPTRSRRP